jgi:hypothetical protein
MAAVGQARKALIWATNWPPVRRLIGMATLTFTPNS